uniref:CSON010953 protein n=1 Tax=Culicoides sonorensis TaxID=179676 RepID=A0A336LKT6_CULSO
MEGDPDSTQPNGTEQLRFIKPNDEVSDLMPMESEVDPRIEKLEPPQFFIRTYDIDDQLKSEIPLKKYAPVYVGRALGCQIDLVEPSISRRHCVFQYKDLIVDSLGNVATGYMIYDLKSSHGTFLNGDRIPSMENIKLKHNDKITLGQCATVFTFWDSKYESSAGMANGTEHEIPNTASTSHEMPPPEVINETVDESLTQQPSSTSQVSEIDVNAAIENDESSDGWLARYIKILNNLADAAKEYEEYGVPITTFDSNSRIGKKFNSEHLKLVQQAQVVAELLSQIGNDEPDEIAPKQRKRKAKAGNSDIVNAPKRSRKSQKNEVNDQNGEVQTEMSPKTKKRGRVAQKPTVNKQKILADEIQKQVNAALVQKSTSNNSDKSSFLGFDQTSFDGGIVTMEEDPLALTDMPIVEQMYECDEPLEENTADSDDEPLQTRVKSAKEPKVVAPVKSSPKKRKPPTKATTSKKAQQIELLNGPTTVTNEPNDLQKSPGKRGRGRPKLQKDVKENKQQTESNAYKQRKSNSRKDSKKVEEMTPSRPNKRGKKSMEISPLKPIDNNAPKRGRKPKKEKEIFLKSNSNISSDIIAVNSPIPPHIKNSYAALTLRINQPIVLVRKLNIQSSNLKILHDPLN